MEAQVPVAVLGGGVAGLAAGLAARDMGLPFRIFEKSGRTGGNCVTFSHGEFRFDSGAHRFHDRDAAATGQFRRLLGDRFQQIRLPSQVRHGAAFLAFPFTAADLAAKLGWPFLLRVAGEVMASRLRRRSGGDDFASHQTRRYGPTLARLFLLNYSEKLWGLPAGRLSAEIAGDRLQGLDSTAFLKALLLPAAASAGHLEGAFYYPDGGIGAISDALAAACGSGGIRTGAEVSRIRHDRRRILAVEIGQKEAVSCAAVVSTLPLDRFLRLLDPAPPADVLAAAAFRFRQLALVALFLDRETVTRAATLYFPEPCFPFTRVSEPKNRSSLMAPPGRTSLVAELPYFPGEPLGELADDRLVDSTVRHLADAGLIVAGQVRDACVRRLADAYPVLEKGVEDRRRAIMAYLSGFANLRVVGRCGTFRYRHIHHLLPEAGQAVASLRLQGGRHE